MIPNEVYITPELEVIDPEQYTHDHEKDLLFIRNDYIFEYLLKKGYRISIENSQ